MKLFKKKIPLYFENEKKKSCDRKWIEFSSK